VKYVTVSLSHDRGVRHPMHQFVVDRAGYRASRLLGSTRTDGVHTALFHVDGWPPGPYEAALSTVDTVHEHALSTGTDETFSVYVREDLTEHGRELTDAFGRAGLVTLLPVVYRADGTARITLVGPSAALQAALEETPDGVSVDVRDVGSYDTRRVGGDRELTARQAEAVRVAVERGYYEDPRAASVADVAGALDCAPSTAAEHLRRAERTVMRSSVRSTPD
jgi:predicted DNA binding protein